MVGLLCVGGVKFGFTDTTFWCGVVCLLGFPSGCVQSIANAVVPSLLRASELERAFRSYFALNAAFSVLGIFLGISLLQSFGTLTAMLFASVVAWFGAATSITLEVAFPAPKSLEQSKRHSARFFEGIEAVLRFKTEVFWNLLSALANAVITPTISLAIPTFVARRESHGAILVACLEGLVSLGVFSGSQVGAKLTELLGLSNRAIVQSAFVGMSLCVILLGIAPLLPVWSTALFVLGFLIVLNNSVVEARRSVAIPQNVRARVQAIHGLLIQSASPAGSLIAGTLLAHTDVSTYLVSGGLTLLVAASLLHRIPYLLSLLQLPADQVEDCYERFFPRPGDEASN